jgi:hypothetical protein
MTKLIIAFRNFAKARNKGSCCVSCHFLNFGPGFRSRPVHVKFVVVEVMLRRVSLRVFRLSFVFIIPVVLCKHSFI